MSQEVAQATTTSVTCETPNPGTALVQMSEKQGKVHLFGWNTGFTGNEDFVAIYKDDFPADPWKDPVWWKYVKEYGPVQNTGLPWGSGWVAAYVARDYRRGGAWGYVCKTAPTQAE